MKDDIVIVGAARTPVGAFNGALSSLPAHELGKVANSMAALQRAGVEAPAQVSEVILGQIHLTAGEAPESGAPGLHCGGNSGRDPGFWGSISCAVSWPAHGGARSRRSSMADCEIVVAGGQGVHEHGAALRLSAQRRQDGQFRNG